MPDKHVEPAGITYDRFRFDRVVDKLLKKHKIKTVCEIPAGGESVQFSIGGEFTGQVELKQFRSAVDIRAQG